MVLGSNKVPSGLRKTGTGTRRKAGWTGNSTDVGCNVMQILLGKRPLLVVQPETVAGDRNGIAIIAIVVRLDEIGMDGKRHHQR